MAIRIMVYAREGARIRVLAVYMMVDGGFFCVCPPVGVCDVFAIAVGKKYNGG